MRGEAALSDTVLTAATVLVSLVLIVLVVTIVFSQQSSMTIVDAYQSIARDIAISLDRAAALAGSGLIEQEIPKGFKLNITIDYKSVFVSSGGVSVESPFSGLIHGGPYQFDNPEVFCIVKSRDDRRVNVVDRPCVCNIGDGLCDPACVVEGKCDQDCYSNEGDSVCNSYCTKNNDGVCDPDCYRNEGDSVWDIDCANDKKDGVCDPDSDRKSDGVCDPDCYERYNRTAGVCDPDCVGSANEDGICYAGCLNETQHGDVITIDKDGICDPDCNKEDGICDPDCNLDPDCQFKCSKLGEDCSVYSPCPGEGICCPGTSVVTSNCCGNGVCESRDMWGPGNKTKWETPYTCPGDCCTGSCPTRPADCEARVDKGDFDSNPCYYDTTGNLLGGTPYWASGTTQVCNEDVQLFLDRRNWDINEVARTIKSMPPEGWGYDYSRYFSIRTGPNSCSAQPASQTIDANEVYTRSDRACCSDPNRCPCASCTYRGPECEGVGFCADHTTAALSILRTLGVPSDHVYGVFINDPRPGRHAFVVYKCDSSLPVNLQLNECRGLPDSTWLRIDGTFHLIQSLSQTPCEEMCVWWNDKGIYAKTEGNINATHGYPYPLNVKCAETGSSNVPCVYDKLCGLQGIECLCEGDQLCNR